MSLLLKTRTLATAAAALFLFTACGKPATDARSPLPATVSQGPTGAVAGAPAAAASDPSLPAVETVLTPPVDTKVDPNAGRTNKAMTRAQESTAMPLPGQNNDHSAPLPAAKAQRPAPASAP